VLAITGVVDVDSAIITLGNLPRQAIGAKVAGLVLVPPVVLNTLLKAGLALSLPGSRKGLPGALALIASAAATAIAAAALILI